MARSRAPRKCGQGVDAEADGDAAGLGHLAAMTREGEAGDVGGGLGAERDGAAEASRLSCVMLSTAAASTSGGHSPLRLAVVMKPVPSALVSTSTSPGFARAVGHHLRGVDEAGDRQAELDLGVAHAVAAEDDGTRGSDSLRPAPQDFLEHAHRQLVVGEADNVEHGLRLAAHRVDVAERVGGGDAAVGVRVVNDRREKIDGLHERERVVDAINPRVAEALGPNEQVRIGHRRQRPHNLCDRLNRQLARSPGAAGVIEQAKFFGGRGGHQADSSDKRTGASSVRERRPGIRRSTRIRGDSGNDHRRRAGDFGGDGKWWNETNASIRPRKAADGAGRRDARRVQHTDGVRSCRSRRTHRRADRLVIGAGCIEPMRVRPGCHLKWYMRNNRGVDRCMVSGDGGLHIT